MRKKLCSRKGFTLVEMLAAMTVLVLLTSAMALGVSAAVKAYRQMTSYSEAQLLSSTLRAVLSDELRYALDVAVDADGQVTGFTSRTHGTDTAFDAAEGRLTLAGEELLPLQAYTGGLELTELSLAYGEGRFRVSCAVANRFAEYETAFDVTALNAPGPA